MPLSLKPALSGAVLALLSLGATLPATRATAQDMYIGEFRLFGNNFCPLGWARADGSLLPIVNNEALFALIGTVYGGDGQTTFALPDLRGRYGVTWGQGPGLSAMALGQKAGTETVTLTQAEMPGHTHPVGALAANATQPNPDNALLATTVDGSGGRASTYSGAMPTGAMAAGTVTHTGGNQPHENMGPFLTGTWCVAMNGIFPQRS